MGWKMAGAGFVLREVLQALTGDSLGTWRLADLTLLSVWLSVS